jgi:tetratricopeptide (TPR) repeat protein
MVNAFESQNFDIATEHVKAFAARKDQDEVLHLVELGTIYHASGRYKEAIETFQQAEKLTSWNDYTSISQETGSVLINESVKTHKLDTYEQVLISMYLAIDYTLLGDWENALVEARRVNRQLDKTISEGHPNYTHNGFAKYLAGMLFERAGEWNDAWVDYRQLYKWDPTFPLNSLGLLRMSSKLRSEEDFQKYRKLFPLAPRYQTTSGEGEIVLLAELGKAPEKIPDPDFGVIPRFMPRFTQTKRLRIKSQQKQTFADTHLLFDIEKAAIIDLEEKRAGMITKRLTSIALKKVALDTAAGSSEKTKGLESLGNIFIYLSERPDLRSWLLLPGSLQVARMTVPVGKHDLIVEELDQNGAVIFSKSLGPVEVKPRSINFLNARSRF